LRPQQQHNTKVIGDPVGGPPWSLAAAPANYSEHETIESVYGWVVCLGSVFTWPKPIIIIIFKNEFIFINLKLLLFFNDLQ
jgi:hypothetical protein